MNDEAVNEAEAHVVQRLSARASHLLAAARQSFDAETRQQLESIEARGGSLAVLADGKGAVSVVVLGGGQIQYALYEVDGEGRSVVRALRRTQ
ncbi:hypothetical protein [Paraburkholderia sp. BR14320]|uniref:hypothetical protein n=1 Tax=unclassified Paraburkholderia TaxID=2615204 RepID=UPI0034CD782C